MSSLPVKTCLSDTWSDFEKIWHHPSERHIIRKTVANRYTHRNLHSTYAKPRYMTFTMWNNHRYPRVYVGHCDHVQPLVAAGAWTRSQRGLKFHNPDATVCVIKWITRIGKRWSFHKTNNICNINYIHTYLELSFSQNDLSSAARARLSLGQDTLVAGRVTV